MKDLEYHLNVLFSFKHWEPLKKLIKNVVIKLLLSKIGGVLCPKPPLAYPLLLCELEKVLRCPT